ncbi:MAG: DUF2437 domain-containing protein, partial [Alphaproteobacteria bacterium]
MPPTARRSRCPSWRPDGTLRTGADARRWIRFTAGGRTAYGILDGEKIAEVTGDPFAGYERTSRTHALGAVKIEVPVIPPTFYCAGKNYVAH